MTIMRVSTNQFNSSSVNSLMSQYSSLAEIQRQITTGQRLNSAADDPVAATRALNINAQIARFADFKSNGGTANDRLTMEESTLNNMSDLIMQARQLMLQANTAVLTPENKNLIATQLTEINAQMVDLANTQDSNGDYIFAGTQFSTKPVTQASTGYYQYNGNQSVKSAQIGETRVVNSNAPGSSIFFNIGTESGTLLTASGTSNTGTGQIGSGKITDSTAWSAAVTAGTTYSVVFNTPNTTFDVIDNNNNVVTGFDNMSYTPGMSITVAGVNVTLTGAPAATDRFTIGTTTKQDIFTTIGRAIDLLRSTADTTTYNYNIEQTLGNFDNATDKILARRAEIGSTMKAIELNADIYDSLSLQYSTMVSTLTETDVPKAASDLAKQQTALQAAQQSFIKIQGMSLMNFL